MRKSLRMIVVAAILGTNLFLAVSPASATCRPEKPSTCEAEYPDLNEHCSFNPNPGLPVVLGICDI